MKKGKVIVSVTNDLYTDQRVDKVCRFLVDQGFDVELVGRKLKNSLPMPSRPYKTHRMGLLFTKGAAFYANYNLSLFFYLMRHKCDVLVSNDLDTLLANYSAKILKSRVELVYDSHEYFTEVPELEGRFAKKVWEKIEGFIFPKLKTISTVNQSIANLYKAKYDKDLFVVRNISPLWKEENLLSRQELNLPEDKKIIIIQGAGINIDRGAEEAVEAMKWVENAVLIIVGDGDVVPQLRAYVQEHKMEQKVQFFGKQPYLRMMNYTYHASIGLTLDKDTNMNYKYSLPNKLFDYIHTNTAVICTPLIEIERIVRQYNVGEVITDFTPKKLAQVINFMLEDVDRLAQYHINCEKAKGELNWEKETDVLKEMYSQVE